MLMALAAFRLLPSTIRWGELEGEDELDPSTPDAGSRLIMASGEDILLERSKVPGPKVEEQNVPGDLSGFSNAALQRTGVSRGFGFVYFVNREDAEMAINKLKGYGYDNLILLG